MTEVLIVMDRGIATAYGDPGYGRTHGHLFDMDEWREADSLEKMQMIVEVQDHAHMLPAHIKIELEQFSGDAL